MATGERENEELIHKVHCLPPKQVNVGDGMKISNKKRSL